jgi:hypothetical protein
MKKHCLVSKTMAEVFLRYSLTKNTTWDFNVDRFKGSVAAFDTPVG